MVRIHRNDAPPRQSVNLVSDEEQPSNASPDEEEQSSSSSSASSNSFDSSSSGTEKTPEKSSSSHLSDFIEEDDEPVPVLKSSSTSWQPVAPKRRRRRTLRKKPRLDEADADEEDSTSSDSTSSDGIPRPEVEEDADDEEEQVETTPPQRTPKKRKRPRRAAAPPCFLDAVNKFVEPLSQEAWKYRNLTLSQILYGEDDENSDGSSVEYVPSTPGESVGSTDSESGESDPPGENRFDGENNPQNRDNGDSSLGQSAPGQRRSVGSPPAGPMQYSGENLSDTEERNSQECPKRSSASKHSSARPRRSANKSSHDEIHTVEQEEFIDLIETGQNEQRKVNNSEPTGLRRRIPDQDKLQNAPVNHSSEGDVIDLVSADECEAVKGDGGAQHSKVENVDEKRDSEAEHTARETVLDIAMPDLPRTEVKCDVEDRSCSKKDDISSLKAEDPCSFSKDEYARACDSSSDKLHYKKADFDMMEEQNKDASAPFTPTHVQQECPKLCINDSKICYTERKVESRPHTYDEEPGCDRMMRSDRKQEVDIKAVDDCESSDVALRSDHVQTHPVSTRNLNGETKVDGSTVVGLGPRHRFNGAKPRGKMPHPDVIRKRVPKTQEESGAWLRFAKAEALDIYRAFTGDAPAGTYRCANTDMMFVRQILGKLGKLMGLDVRSEKEGSGRRIILEKDPLRSIGGSAEEVEQAIEGFFYDALADLTNESKQSKHLVKVSERKNINELTKTPMEETGKIHGTGNDDNASPRTGPSRAPSHRRRRGKRKQSLRVVGKG